MSSPSLNSDADDSNAVFRSSILPKRKATENFNSKNSKQSKHTVLKKEEEEKKNASPNCKNFHQIAGEIFENNDFTYEPKSIYFNRKLKNKCPLCHSLFESDTTYMAHMKQCAKKHQMSTKDLLTLLENKKKELKSNHCASSIKICEFDSKTHSKESSIKYSRSLDLAFSKDICDQNDQKSSNEVRKEKAVSIKRPQTTFDKRSAPSPKKRRGKKIKLSILSERTNEDRQRIITEKAAVILLDEDKPAKQSPQHKHVPMKSHQLNQIRDRVCHLWSLGDNEKSTGWYVEKVKMYFLPEESPLELEIIESKVSPVEDPLVELDSLEGDDLTVKVAKLNLPQNTIHEEWRKMINNENFSDLIVISSDKHTVYLHSLVLNVRCATILERDWKSTFQKYDISTILVFLEYLYCGTLKSLKRRSSLHNLINLTNEFNYQQLNNVLNSLESNFNANDEDCIALPSALYENSLSMLASNNAKNAKVSSPREKAEEDMDLFEDEMRDLTQKNCGSSTEDDDSNGTNLEKSYWSFMQCEKRKEEELQRNEEKEDSAFTLKLKKIESSMMRQEEIMEKLLSEFEVENSDKKENEKAIIIDRRDSTDSTTQDLPEEFISKSKTDDNCIIISSDSESQGTHFQMGTANAEKPEPGTNSPEYSACDIPYFDPFEDYNHFSNCNFSPVEFPSQSLITGEVSEYGPIHLEETLKLEDNVQEANKSTVSIRRSLTFGSSNKKSLNKSKRKRSVCDLSASRLLRKSLRLPSRPSKQVKSKRSSLKGTKRKSETEENDWLDRLTNTIIQEFSNSPTLKSSTPVHLPSTSVINKEFVEMTPHNPKDIEIEEFVTPYPNYSRMEEGLLKEHLSKYGLKKNLGKRKAQQILKRIYDELHPYMNKKTGKLVRKVINNTPKNQSKGKKKTNQDKLKKTEKKKKEVGPSGEEERVNSDSSFDRDIEPLDFSLADLSDYEDEEGGLSQKDLGNAQDLPEAMVEFLKMDPDLHEKILLYEPICPKQLQSKLKETFKKHYKMEDIINYLDEECVAFRLQKKTIQNRKNKGEAIKKITDGR